MNKIQAVFETYYVQVYSHSLFGESADGLLEASSDPRTANSPCLLFSPFQYVGSLELITGGTIEKLLELVNFYRLRIQLSRIREQLSQYILLKQTILPKAKGPGAKVPVAMTK